MLSIISAAMPCVFGGSSYTVQPRYVVEIGSTHSGVEVLEVGGGHRAAVLARDREIASAVWPS